MGRMRQGRGFTLIEVMITIAVATVLIMLAAPSFQDMILMQRLRGVSAQLHTDLQLARTEAVTRGRYVSFNLGSDANQTCYVISVRENAGSTYCNCLNSPVCPPNADGKVFVEIKTVSVPKSGQVQLEWPSTQDTAFAYDYVTGGLVTSPSDDKVLPLPEIKIDASIDETRRLRSQVSQTGRPKVCAPYPDRMQAASC